jgi:Site-specific recombinase XerD
MSTTISVVAYTWKQLKNNELPLYLRITKDRKKKHISLNVSLKPEYWDFGRSRPNKNCPRRDEIEKIITDTIKVYQDQLFDYKVQNKEFTINSLVQKATNPVKAKTVKEVFDLYIRKLKNENRIRYAEMFMVTLNSLIKFNGHLDIYFYEIDIAWLKRYETYMYNEGLAMNTLELRFVRLRTIFNYAIEEKIVKADYYPFKAFKVSKLKQKTAKRSILKSEVLKVLDYKGKTDYECLAIDLFTFSYLTAGINFIDMSNLTIENIIDNRVSYLRKKTKKLITIPMQPKAIELINKYRKETNLYLFPILSSFHKTEQQKINRRHKVISKVNKCLKEIGEELKIPIPLTTYVSRHSYATVLKRSGVSTSIISESLGHSSEKITQIYLDSFENSQIDEAMKNLL